MEKINTLEFKEKVIDFDRNVKMNSTPVIVDFYADWCGPCKVLAPILEELEKENGFKLYKVDVDEEYELSKQYDIRSIPSILFVPVKNDPSIHTGAYPKGEIKKLIVKYFNE